MSSSNGSNNIKSSILIVVAIIGALGVCGVPVVNRLLDIYLPAPTSQQSTATPVKPTTQATIVPFQSTSSTHQGSVLCPSTISRSKVNEWSIGATDGNTASQYLE